MATNTELMFLIWIPLGHLRTSLQLSVGGRSSGMVESDPPNPELELKPFLKGIR